jgi:hypothetical protein
MCDSDSNHSDRVVKVYDPVIRDCVILYARR